MQPQAPVCHGYRSHALSTKPPVVVRRASYVVRSTGHSVRRGWVLRTTHWVLGTVSSARTSCAGRLVPCSVRVARLLCRGRRCISRAPAAFCNRRSASLFEAAGHGWQPRTSGDREEKGTRKSCNDPLACQGQVRAPRNPATPAQNASGALSVL